MPNDTDVGPNSGWKQIDGKSTIEVLTKGIAVVTGLGLGVALLYDAVYFRILDLRLPGLLVMSDHIETAISTLPYLGLAAIFLWSLPYFVERLVSHRWVAAGALALALSLIACIVIWPQPPWFVHVMAIVGGTVGMLMSLLLPRVNQPKTKLPFGAQPKNLIAYTLLTLMLVTVVMAMVLALTDRHNLRDPKASRDSILFTDLSSMTGVILRMIDRGVIFGVPGERPYVIFIPKDQIKRVDLMVTPRDRS
jgi:hypothetical protein